MNFLHIGAAAAASLIMSSAGAATVVSTFDDLALAPNSHYFPQATTSFTSGGASFNHDYADYGIPGCCWNGWSYSNETNTTSGDYSNQYSAITGGGAAGSANYAVGFLGAPVVTLATPSTVSGLYVTNTTYTALSMAVGDSFAKKFGGASGNDADYLRLTITGLDASAHATGSVDFYLADYRFSDNSQDYILKDWAFVNLSSLGNVSALSFSMASSDVGDFGMNTPAYFAIDNLSVLSAVPDIGSGLMAFLGMTGVMLARRRRTGL